MLIFWLLKCQKEDDNLVSSFFFFTNSVHIIYSPSPKIASIQKSFFKIKNFTSEKKVSRK